MLVCAIAYTSTCSYLHAGLADADPLGVNVNVTFDNVGGLDDREYHSLMHVYAGLSVQISTH